MNLKQIQTSQCAKKKHKFVAMLTVKKKYTQAVLNGYWLGHGLDVQKKKNTWYTIFTLRFVRPHSFMQS